MRERGQKRFKPKKETVKRDSLVLNINEMSLQDAKAHLHKRFNSSAYQERYGREANSVDPSNTEILKYKKISDLPCASILTRAAITALDTWQKSETSDYHVSLVIKALRSIKTASRARAHVVTTSRERMSKFTPTDLLTNDRFD